MAKRERSWRKDLGYKYKTPGQKGVALDGRGKNKKNDDESGT
jgi:hypothetical protein